MPGRFQYFLLLSIVLSSCDHKSKKQLPLLPKTNLSDSMYCGSWQVTSSFFSSILTLHDDHTYKFEIGQCTWNGWSTGKWGITNDNISLLSDAPDSCICKLNYGNWCEVVDPEITDTARMSFKSVNDCVTNLQSCFILFDNVTFSMRNDTLKLDPDILVPCSSEDLHFIRSARPNF